MRSLFCAAALVASAIVLESTPSHASLIADWTFDNASNLGADSSGNNINLTVHGATAASGLSGGGVALNGSSWLDTSSSLIPTGSAAYTLVAQFQTANSAANIGMAIVEWGSGSYDNANSLRLTNYGQQLLGNEWWGNNLDAAASYADGQWHTAMATWDGTTQNIYFDGQLIGTQTPATAPNVSPSTPFNVGRATWYGNTDYYTGTLDNVAVFNTALAPTQVATALSLTATGSPVPEPASLGLFLTFAGLTGYIRRRRAG